MEHRGQLDRAGAGIVAIGNGTPEQAKEFLDKSGFTGELYVSPDRAAYRSFGLVRGRFRTLGPASILRALRALASGFRQGSQGGDNWQQGGLFLLGPVDSVRFVHRDRFAGDLAKMEDVLASLE